MYLPTAAKKALAPVRLGDVAYISFVRDPDGNWIEISQRKSITGSRAETGAGPFSPFQGTHPAHASSIRKTGRHPLTRCTITYLKGVPNFFIFCLLGLSPFFCASAILPIFSAFWGDSAGYRRHSKATAEDADSNAPTLTNLWSLGRKGFARVNLGFRRRNTTPWNYFADRPCAQAGDPWRRSIAPKRRRSPKHAPVRGIEENLGACTKHQNGARSKRELKQTWARIEIKRCALRAILWAQI
ncbi:MAG: hypothetical protein CM15mP68_1580 [Pseudomonadota bacterium]|nr:MAG: hypothetical protein CM15mP68_1580 [Pseudomonadota bacterium]